MTITTTTKSGWLPFAIATPSSYAVSGNAGREAVVMVQTGLAHRAAQSYYASSACQGASVHFLVSRSGQINQLVNISDSARLNGSADQASIVLACEGTAADGWTVAMRTACALLVGAIATHCGHAVPVVAHGDVSVEWVNLADSAQAYLGTGGHWVLWGDHFPLDPLHRRDPIPRKWVQGLARLGGARSPVLELGGALQVQVFQGGFLWWWQGLKQPEIVWLPRRIA